MAKKTTKKEKEEIKKVEVEKTNEELEAPIEETNEEQVEVISLDNVPVDPIVVENDDEIIPNNFIPTKKTTKNKKGLLVHNGRIYKVLNNGRGMYADNGETFNLSEIK